MGRRVGSRGSFKLLPTQTILFLILCYSRDESDLFKYFCKKIISKCCLLLHWRHPGSLSKRFVLPVDSLKQRKPHRPCGVLPESAPAMFLKTRPNGWKLKLPTVGTGVQQAVQHTSTTSLYLKAFAMTSASALGSQGKRWQRSNHFQMEYPKASFVFPEV